VAWKDALCDANVANYLFRLDPNQLQRPGLIRANWNRDGKLLSETIWSFEDLQRYVRVCIRLLQQEGFVAGDRVLLMVRPGLELITLCFALFRMGVVPVVMDPGMGLEKFRRAVAQSQPNGLIGIAVAHGVSRIFKRSFASISKRLVIRPAVFLKQLQSGQEAADLEVAQTNADHLAAVLFTSGSTGAPKGVCYEHGMFDAQIRMLRAALDIQPGEVDLPMLPVFALFNPALGMTTVLPDMNPSRPAKVNPAKVVAAMERYGVTNSFGSPVLWRKIGDWCDATGRTFRPASHSGGRSGRTDAPVSTICSNPHPWAHVFPLWCDRMPSSQPDRRGNGARRNCRKD
jgi:olefin beta-lactone synthetase